MSPALKIGLGVTALAAAMIRPDFGEGAWRRFEQAMARMAGLCWALQGWLPPAWALFGAFLALRLCLFSYWMDSYWGGALAGIGGALVLGAYARIVRQGRSAYAWLLGLGLVILANIRMYEGALYAITILIALGFRRVKARVWATVASVLALGTAFILLYDYRVTGRP